MLRAKFLIAKYLLIFLVALSCFSSLPVSVASSQVPTVQDLLNYSHNLLQNNSDSRIVSSCLRLDGRCAFKIAFPKSQLAPRIEEIQQRLNKIKNIYLDSPQQEIQFNTQTETSGIDIYAIVDRETIRLLTITPEDANFEGISLKGKADSVISELETKFLEAKQQRTQEYLLRQGIYSLIILSAIALIYFLSRRWRKNTRTSQAELTSPNEVNNLPIFKNLRKKEKWHFQEIKYRCLQIAEYSVFPVGLLLVLGLFPHTRALQLVLVTAIRIPLRIGLIGILTYLIIRLAYALVNRLGSSILRSQFILSPRANKRLQLRVNTISQVSRGILTITFVITGALAALWSVGVNITPFLAGAGIVGLGLSFASQSFIKDALNGFLIIFEDQYGVGDVINLNNVAGKVEKINLRITQIRDAEGRLITIPNSEIKIVANLSSQWSQADLKIPIAYSSDLQLAIQTITEVASNMSQEQPWQDFILEPPLILGVEEFSDRGIIIRLFIKTEPLKQWDVSREFRLRLQTQLQEKGVPIVAPEQILDLKKE